MRGFIILLFVLITSNSYADLTPSEKLEASSDSEFSFHFRKMIHLGLTTKPNSSMVVWAVAYGKTGTEERTAARRILRYLYKVETGIDPTISLEQRHTFKHWVESYVGGEGFEA